MKIASHYLILLLILSLGIHGGCHEKRESVTNASPIAQALTTNPVSGTWKLHRDHIWYSSTLTLLEDGSFGYESQGCLGQKYSKGNWERRNNIIILTSFDSLKPKVYEPFFISDEKTNTISNTGRIIFHSNVMKIKSELQSFANAPVYFNNIQLQLINDTLYSIDSNSLLTNSRYYKSKSD